MSSAAVSTGALASVRLAVADVLETGPYDVHRSVVDAVAGPCLIVTWAEPWLEPLGGSCNYMTHPAVLCVAGRVEPGPAIELLEDQIAYTIGALRTLARPPAFDRVDTPTVTTFGGVEYLTARITYRSSVTITERIGL